MLCAYARKQAESPVCVYAPCAVAAINSVQPSGIINADQACLLLQGADKEVIVRGMHDCWVVARHRNGRDLYLVMEGKGEIGLAGAAELATDFADKQFAALF